MHHRIASIVLFLFFFLHLDILFFCLFNVKNLRKQRGAICINLFSAPLDYRYDSLTGVPSCQRTVAFEKACVLFNMAAIYTQMGAKQDRLTSKGLDQAVDNFLRAAGTFTYIQENFTNAPSMDLAPHMMDMLIQLMLVSAGIGRWGERWRKLGKC